MIKKGFSLNAKSGVWEKLSTAPVKVATVKPKEELRVIKRGRTSNNESVITDSIETGEGWCKITLSGLAPGLNGSKGLMREHWTAGMKRRDGYVIRVTSLNPPQLKGQVKITYIRYCSLLSDWDNCCASFKKIGDSLKISKVIEDDSPLFIVEFLPKQIKCRRKDQRTVILIEKISASP